MRSMQLILLSAVAISTTVTVQQSAVPIEKGEEKPGVVHAQGTLAYKQQVSLSFDRPGVLAEVLTEEGQQVAKGDLVARLSDSVARTSLATANAEAESDARLMLARKQQEAAEVEHKQLVVANRRAPNTYPKSNIDRLRLAAEVAAAQAKVAEHESVIAGLSAKQAEAELATFSIRSPIKGVVTRKLKQPGESVPQGESLLEIVDTEVVRVTGFVAANDAFRLKVGDPVEVRIRIENAALPIEDETFKAKLGFVDLRVEPTRGVVRVWADLTNADGRLRDGMFADLTIRPE